MEELLNGIATMNKINIYEIDPLITECVLGNISSLIEINVEFIDVTDCVNNGN